jgi:CheY-like chemotaxis protein
MTISPDVHALLIDDDAGVIFYHQMIITESTLDVDVFTFDNGTEAIQYIKEKKGESDKTEFLIFLDISMPVMSGWDFITYLEENGLSDNIYIVMVTASLNENDKKRALAHPNVVFYTDKPITQSACNDLRKLNSLSHLPI